MSLDFNISKSKQALLWNTIDKFVAQGTGFILGLVLARILQPSDYGTIGMLAIFMAIAQLLIESGFSSALIQKHTPSENDYSTVFYFNLFISVTLYIGLYISAPLIADFYKTPELTQITRILSLSIIINAFSIVQQTKLTIILDFKTQAKVSFFSVLISGTLGLLIAYNGYGVWALVIQNITFAFLRTSAFYYYNRWRPLLKFNIVAFKELFHFSSNLLVAGGVATIMNNIYSILIGRYFNAKKLGFYTNAKQYPEYLSTVIISIINGVSFPLMSSLKNDHEAMLLVYRRIMRVTVFFVMPILTLFALLSEPFIRLILTDKWLPIAPLIQWMCFVRLITPISALNMNILNAIGRSDLFLKLDLSKIPMVIITMIITLPLGLKAVVIGHFITSFLAFFINTYYPGKFFGYGAIKQLMEMKNVIFATLIMSLCVFGSGFLFQSDLLKLIFGTTIGFITYLTASYLLKIDEINDIMELLKSFSIK